MDLFFRRGDEVHAASIEPDRSSVGAPQWLVRIGDREQIVTLRRHRAGRLELLVDGQPLRAHVACDGRERWVQIDGGQPARFEKADSARAARHTAAEGLDALIADTPAAVVSVLVAVGDNVTHGDTLLVLEAMKMEFRLTAPHDGHVTAVHCQEGEVVERGRLLLEVEVV